MATSFARQHESPTSPSRQIQESPLEKNLTSGVTHNPEQSQDITIDLAKLMGWSNETANYLLKKWDKTEKSPTSLSSETTKPSDKPIDPDFQALVAKMYTESPFLTRNKQIKTFGDIEMSQQYNNDTTAGSSSKTTQDLSQQYLANAAAAKDQIEQSEEGIYETKDHRKFRIDYTKLSSSYVLNVAKNALALWSGFNSRHNSDTTKMKKNTKHAIKTHEIIIRGLDAVYTTLTNKDPYPPRFGRDTKPNWLFSPESDPPTDANQALERSINQMLNGLPDHTDHTYDDSPRKIYQATANAFLEKMDQL